MMKKSFNEKWRNKDGRSQERHTLQVSLLGRSGGQQIIEYALVIAAISAALLGMYIYTKRGLQATIKDAVDNEIGAQIDSAPLASVTDTQTSVSTSQTLTGGSTRTQKSGETGGMAQYSFDASSTSTAESVSVSNQLEK